jgi:hypothetical protein
MPLMPLAAQMFGQERTEAHFPIANRLMGERESSLQKHLL